MTTTNVENAKPTENSGYGQPYVSKHLPVVFKNILQVIEDELSQPQVEGISLAKHTGFGPSRVLVEPSLTVKFGEKKDGHFSEFSIPIDKENYDEAVRFLVKNSVLFSKKYSIDFVPYLNKNIEDIPVNMYRNYAYREATASEKEPVTTTPLLQGVNDFVAYQMENPDVTSVSVEPSAIAPGENLVTVALISGAKVEFIIAD